MSRVGRVASRAAGLPRALFVRLRALAGTLRAGARRESRRRRLVWIAIAALLVLGPLIFNLARSPGFDATVELFPRAVEPYDAIRDHRYYRELLDDPVLREQMRLNADARTSDYDDIEIEGGGARGRPLELTVSAETPARARRLVNALGPQLAGASQRQLARQADADEKRVRAELRTRLTSEEREDLRDELDRLKEFGEFPPARVLPGAPARLPTITRPADKLVNDLPGDFRGRPSPVWSALAGLLVTLTLWAICLVLLPPRGGPEGESLPQPD